MVTIPDPAIDLVEMEDPTNQIDEECFTDDVELCMYCGGPLFHASFPEDICCRGRYEDAEGWFQWTAEEVAGENRQLSFYDYMVDRNSV